MKITKRDVLCFFIGILTYFAINTVVDWESNKKAFIDGYNKGRGIESLE